MDEERRIRFLVSPALFVASLLIGALSDPTARKFIVDILEASDLSKSLIELAAGGGVVVFRRRIRLRYDHRIYRASVLLVQALA